LSKDNLSNANNEDEQSITDGDDSQLEALFAASYSGNDEEASRLQKEAAGDDDTTTETTEGTVPNETVDEDDSIQIASSNLNEEDQTTTEQTQDSSTDEIASIREQLHRAKSDAGRVPHLNRRVQELERELTRLRTPAAKPESTTDLPANLKTKLEKMKEIDPETAELMEEMYRTANSRTEEIAAAYERYTSTQAQREDEAHLRSEYEKVVSAIPEAEEVFRSPEWENWKSRLTPAHRAMADSIHANEVVTALQAFKVDAQNLFGGYKWGKPPTTPTPSAPPQKSAAARAAENSRASRLATSATVKEGTARANTAELDLEALFKSAYEDGIRDSTPNAK